MKRFLLLLGLLGSVVLPVLAQDSPRLELYYGEECPHCHEEIDWLESVKGNYPHLIIESYEVWHDQANAQRWKRRMAELGEIPKGVPTNIIDDRVIVGFKKEAIAEALGIELKESKNQEVEEPDFWKRYLDLSWPVMSLVLGLIDGFNPCAMWTLFMLISLLLVIDDRRKRWMIGGVFLATSGVIYGAALLTYLWGFNAITTMLAGSAIGYFFRLVGMVALVTGAITLYQAPKVGIECSVRSGESKKRFHESLKSILERDHFWLVLLGIAGLAISVNAVELLCSFAIPTTFTATLISLDLPLYQQLIGVGIYDLAYMLDDLLVFSIAMWTLSLKVFSPRITQVMHIVGGLVLLILGAMLLLDPSFLAV